jgi:hypothetical protein
VALSVSAAPANTETDDSGNPEVLNKYLNATQIQQAVLRGVQMEIDIDAKLPRLSKHGTLRALRTISKLGLITFKSLGFSGDDTVKKEVIARYLSAESEARDSGSLAITPANYKFKYKNTQQRDGRLVTMFQITPRKKNVVGLFKGELWMDTETGMPLRESGQLVKNPSIFLKKIAFVRDYEIRDGIAYPKHIESTVDTRLVGRAELSINFSNFTREENADDDVIAGNGSQ